VSADSMIMVFPLAIHVNAESQILRGLIFVQLPFQQQCIGAEVDIFLSFDNPSDDLRHLRMDQWLPPWDADHRNAAFIDRCPALLWRQTLVKNVIGILDFSTSR